MTEPHAGRLALVTGATRGLAVLSPSGYATTVPKSSAPARNRWAGPRGH